MSKTKSQSSARAHGSRARFDPLLWLAADHRELEKTLEGASKADDPIFSLIEAHKRALKAWEDSFSAFGDDGDPKLERAAKRALVKMAKTQPCTNAGASALLAYVVERERIPCGYLDDADDVVSVMMGVAKFLSGDAKRKVA